MQCFVHAMLTKAVYAALEERYSFVLLNDKDLRIIRVGLKQHKAYSLD